MQYALTESLALIVGKDSILEMDGQEKIEDYLKDMADYPSEPLVVVQPRTNDQVSRIVECAVRTRIPIVARGAGTSLTGASCAHGGIVIDFSKHMNQVLNIDCVNWYVHCQAGTVIQDLNDELKKRGFFFPPDPSSASWCTVGGAIAENSGGMKCFRYGTVKDWVLSLRVVLSNGSVVKLGEPLPKNRVGYDLVHLICGSEGTLALITEAWLKILPLPRDAKDHKRMLVFFDTWDDAGKAIQTLRQSRIQPVLIEFIDLESTQAVNSSFDLGIPEHNAILFIEADSYPADILRICRECGSLGDYVAKDEADGERLYNARALVYLAVKALATATHTEDVVVPLDKLTEYLRFVNNISRKYGLKIPVNGHAGDGNVHPVILFDKSSERSIDAANKAFLDICNYAIEVGGTISGEHGIGEQKVSQADAQIKAHNGESVANLMRQIKRLMDPDNLLNPGKFLKLDEHTNSVDRESVTCC